MNITPRKEEVAQLVAILESGDYTGPEPMAKALLKTAADILAMREWWALSHRFHDGQLGINWAPFASSIEATRAAEKIALNGQFGVIKLHSSGVLLANITSSKKKGWCQHPACGHADWMHHFEASARGKCGLETCRCDKFRK